MSVYFPEQDPDLALEAFREECDLGERCPRCNRKPTPAYPIVAVVELDGTHWYECRNCNHTWRNYFAKGD